MYVISDSCPMFQFRGLLFLAILALALTAMASSSRCEPRTQCIWPALQRQRAVSQALREQSTSSPLLAQDHTRQGQRLQKAPRNNTCQRNRRPVRTYHVYMLIISPICSLLLLLFEAERLYAFAQELYAAGEHHKAIAKHRRSLSWAEKLTALCSQLPSTEFPPSALLEIHVYSRIISGRLALKKDDFGTALASLAAAHHILDMLTQSYQSTRDQALASVFIDDISPEIRYCAHELKSNRAHEIPRIVASVGPKECEQSIPNFPALSKAIAASPSTAGKSTQTSWTWEGKAVPIRSPELVDVLEKVQNAERKLNAQEKQGNKARMAIYDAILQAWSEATDVARKLLEMQKVLNRYLFRSKRTDNIKSKSSSYGESSNDAQFILDFVTFHVLTQRSSRDLLLISALRTTDVHKPSTDERANSAVLKLIDTLLQNLEQARSLGIVDESPDLSILVEACLSFYKAKR
jgi:signal recognition particle subunit SRP68